MKRIFLAFLLMLLLIVGARAAAIGDTVDVKASIGSVNADRGIVTSDSCIYVVDSMSTIIVNGKRGTIQDLLPGMRMTGSGEVIRAEDSRQDLLPEIKLRMVDAKTPMAGAPGSSVTSQAFTPQGVPSGQPVTPEAKALMQNLAGAFWKLKGVKDDSNWWFCFNGDGTVTCGWYSREGTWTATDSTTITASFPEKDPITIRFDRGLTKGQLSEPLEANGSSVVIRVESPTKQMRYEVAALPKQTPLPRQTAPPMPSGGAPRHSTPSPPQVSPETQNAAAEVISVNHSNLVFVTGKAGAGSGFIANMNGTNCLVTNAHVAAGISDANFKTLDGSVVKGSGAASVAVGHDIFLMALPAGGAKPFEIMQGVDENARIGDDIVVLGNAEGSGVINTIMGKIVGIGPSLVEIDAKFVPGNSGSPIVHLKTGKVIGVATYTVTKKYDATTHEKMAKPVVRRYGYRLDSVKTWQVVNLRTFYAEADALEKVHTLTTDLDGFFNDISENKGKVTVERHSNPVIKNRIAQWVAEKSGRLSKSDSQDSDANFLSFLKIACKSDTDALQGRLSYDYFQRELADDQETRTEMANAFSQIIQDIQH